MEHIWPPPPQIPDEIYDPPAPRAFYFRPPSTSPQKFSKVSDPPHPQNITAPPPHTPGNKCLVPNNNDNAK